MLCLLLYASCRLSTPCSLPPDAWAWLISFAASFRALHLAPAFEASSFFVCFAAGFLTAAAGIEAASTPFAVIVPHQRWSGWCAPSEDSVQVAIRAVRCCTNSHDTPHEHKIESCAKEGEKVKCISFCPKKNKNRFLRSAVRTLLVP
jgi:hypothetical protein